MKFTISYTTMNLFAFFLTIFTLLGSFVAQAAPLQPRDVYVPHILNPKKGDMWTVGQTVQVTWDASSPPKEITNPIGQVQLGKTNRILPIVLAGNFSILKGSVSFTVPMVTPDDDYFVVLFGDSGNWSGNITINSPFTYY